MKIAVTYDANQIWQHFGKTKLFKIYEVTQGKIDNSTVVDTEGASHGELAAFLAQQKIDVVICGGVGAPMVQKLETFGMQVIPGITGNADDAVNALLNGTLRPIASAIHEGCHHHTTK